MRTVDRWVGVPLCFALTLFSRLLTRFKTVRQQPTRRILFIELSEMGSTILADPAMRKVRKQQDAELYFVIFKRNQPSLELIGTISREQTFTIREDNLGILILDTLRFLRWTRLQKIDTVIDLELFSRFTALLCGLSGASNRVGFYSFHNEGLYRGDLLTHKVAYNPHMHIAKNFIALVNALLTKEEEVPFSKQRVEDEEVRLPVIEFSETETQAMRETVTKHFPQYNPATNRLILINPNASELLPQRRWMPERYRELMQRILATNEQVVVLVTGAPSEKPEADRLCAEVDNTRGINFAGALQLKQLPVLYSIADLMITNDSGPGHFSSITALPTFILFGPETPALYGSLGNGYSIFAGLACSPCVSAANHRKTPCTDNKCLQAISVDQVFSAIKPFLPVPGKENRIPQK
jgi:ADP-heptose:LPS heptosyltransferase